MNIVEKMAVAVSYLEEESGWPDHGDALADLENWKNGGHASSGMHWRHGHGNNI